MSMAAAKALLLHQARGDAPACFCAASPRGFAGTTAMLSFPRLHCRNNKRHELSTRRIPSTRPKAEAAAAAAAAETVTEGEQEEKKKGMVLLTMTVPKNTDLQKLETLLYEWAIELPEVAKKRLTRPLKVDRIKGGVRLGFARIVESGTEEVPVYIDCIILPPKKEGKRTFTIPVVRAIRNVPVTGKLPRGEKGVLNTLVDAHQKWVRMFRVPS